MVFFWNFNVVSLELSLSGFRLELSRTKTLRYQKMPDFLACCGTYTEHDLTLLALLIPKTFICVSTGRSCFVC